MCKTSPGKLGGASSSIPLPVGWASRPPAGGREGPSRFLGELVYFLQISALCVSPLLFQHKQPTFGCDRCKYNLVNSGLKISHLSELKPGFGPKQAERTEGYTFYKIRTNSFECSSNIILELVTYSLRWSKHLIFIECSLCTRYLTCINSFHLYYNFMRKVLLLGELHLLNK